MHFLSPKGPLGYCYYAIALISLVGIVSADPDNAGKHGVSSVRKKPKVPAGTNVPPCQSAPKPSSPLPLFGPPQPAGLKAPGGTLPIDSLVSNNDRQTQASTAAPSVSDSKPVAPSSPLRVTTTEKQPVTLHPPQAPPPTPPVSEGLRAAVGDHSVSRWRRGGFAGISNQGATCYMNSILQVLHHLKAFRDIVAGTSTIPDEENSNVIKALQRVFTKLDGTSTVDAKKLTKAFGWSPRDQQDPTEFLAILLRKLDIVISLTDNAAAQQEVNATLTGSFKYSRLPENKSVEWSSVTREDFYSIPLSIDDIGSVDEAFTHQFKTEVLTGSNGVVINGVRESIQVSSKIERAPKALALQLLRYSYNPVSGTVEKNNKIVTFPKELDISAAMSEDASGDAQTYKYSLYAILVHSGTAQMGHYFSFITDPRTEIWREFNDSVVRKINEEDAMTIGSGERAENTSAYMLFYVRNDAIDSIL